MTDANLARLREAAYPWEPDQLAELLEIMAISAAARRNVAQSEVAHISRGAAKLLRAALALAPVRSAEPVAWITKAGLQKWLAGSEPEHHVLLRSGGELRVPLYASPLPASGEMREALEIADAAINPPDRGGLSLDKWNERLKAATVAIRAALNGGER